MAETAPSSPAAAHARWCAVVLNWNGREDTLRCLASLEAVPRSDLALICVDNGSSDGSVAAVRERFGQVELIEAGTNLGYSAGNNLGIRRALERGADWVVLVNNDATVAPDVIDGFEAALQQRPRAGILAGKVFFADRPEVLWFAGQRVSRLLGYSGRPRGYGRKDGGRYEAVRATDRGVGALMAISRDALERAGALDERLFAYVEDVELSLRVSAAGYEVIFAPGARAWHRVSGSTGGAEASTYPLYYGTRNTIVVLERLRPLGRVGNLLRRLSVLATFALHALSRAGRRRALRAVLDGYRDAAAGRLGERPA